MPLPNCRSSVIGGFLDTAHDLTENNPEAQRMIADARREIAGEYEPEREDERREALACWATQRWAPICLRLAGFDRTAEMLEGSRDTEEAADLLNDFSVEVPPDPSGEPRDLDQVAGRAAAMACGAAMRIQQCIGPAFTALMAAEATRRSHTVGMCPRRLSMADEVISAAARAMDGRGPESSAI